MSSSWETFLEAEFRQAYFIDLATRLKTAYATSTVYPSKQDLFKAFSLCPYPDMKVVILGQDPYHQANQAHGLAFSVPEGVPFPPSLRNIFQELSHDLGCSTPTHGDLSAWARQGVFLLNTHLSVEANQALSHQHLGWSTFSDHVLKHCNAHPRPLVFILWGKAAQAKRDLISDGRHCVLEAPHPSPLSSYQGFFGSRPFSQANDFIAKQGQKIIQWCL